MGSHAVREGKRETGVKKDIDVLFWSSAEQQMIRRESQHRHSSAAKQKNPLQQRGIRQKKKVKEFDCVLDTRRKSEKVVWERICDCYWCWSSSSLL